MTMKMLLMFIHIILFVIFMYYFIKICILYFRNRKEDIDKFEKLCNATLMEEYSTKVVALYLLIFTISRIIDYLGG